STGNPLPALHVSDGIFAPYVKSSAKRSPTFARRSGIVRRLNFFGSSFLLISSQRSGADTGAPSIARSEYGATIVFPYPFCMQSRYNRPRRLAIARSTVIEGTFAATAALIEQAK